VYVSPNRSTIDWRRQSLVNLFRHSLNVLNLLRSAFLKSNPVELNVQRAREEKLFPAKRETLRWGNAICIQASTYGRMSGNELARWGGLTRQTFAKSGSAAMQLRAAFPSAPIRAIHTLEIPNKL
jgi:hypothetical protein